LQPLPGSEEHSISGPIPLLIADESAFKALYDQYWGKVLAVCFQATKDLPLAEDLMHELFQSLWERKDELRVEGQVENYLVRAARLKVLAHYRDTTNRTEHFGRAMQDYSGAEESTENEVNYVLLTEQVTTLVAQLPHPCRTVYEMSRERGLSNKTIASSLVLSEKTVEYHLTRALRFLSKHLVGYRF
jgi:RNA polymerase sigma-70 factor (family 1)